MEKRFQLICIQVFKIVADIQKVFARGTAIELFSS
jgi:hypothetical protein